MRIECNVAQPIRHPRSERTKELGFLGFFSALLTLRPRITLASSLDFWGFGCAAAIYNAILLGVYNKAFHPSSRYLSFVFGPLTLRPLNCSINGQCVKFVQRLKPPTLSKQQLADKQKRSKLEQSSANGLLQMPTAHWPSIS